MSELDATDIRLLGALQDDGAATNGELAERIGLSPSQASRRRQRLEEAGIITGYRAMLDPASVGLSVTAFVHIALDTHSRDNARRFRDLVNLTPSVIEAHALTGEADYLVKVLVRDLKALSALINDVFLPHESVARVRSEVVLESIKLPGRVPVPRA